MSGALLKIGACRGIKPKKGGHAVYRRASFVAEAGGI